MKKLLLLSSAVFALTFAAISQNAGQRFTATKTQGHYSSPGIPSFKTTETDTFVVYDTLHYYLNKYYFKTATTEFTNFPYYKSAASTVTNVTHCGSRFDVPAGETVTITGLEAYARRQIPAANLSIPIRIMLCKLNAQGMPVLPPIDSVSAAVNGSAISLIGGNLNSPRTMTTSFAILFRNLSTVAGDTARLLRTAGTTPTNVNSPQSTKCSDFENGNDYGYVRYNGVFYSTKDFTLAPGFGVGTAYEFVVAPRVVYKLQASQIMPSFVVATSNTVTVPDTVCTRTDMVFTNTSSGFYEHRQYNLNQFYRKWNLYSPFPPFFANAFSSDSSITWNFEFYDDGSRPDSRVFLPYVNNHTITAVTGLSNYPDCFTANQFRARLKPMGALGKVPQLVWNQDFIVCFKYCNGDTVGIKSVAGDDNLKIYPNPAVNGKTIISGLNGKNSIAVYNMIGQLILTEITESSVMEINLAKQPKGTYIVRIVDAENQSRVVKVVNQD